MAKFINADTRRAIRAAVDNNNKVYRWRRVDCVTLAYDVLEAQGIVADQDRLDTLGVLRLGSHSEAMAKIRETYSDMGAFLCSVLDAIPELERVESPYDWDAGMVGLTPQTGIYHMGFRKVDASEVGGAVLGVVDDRNIPVVLSMGKGVVPVSKLWPRWADARTLTR